MPPHSYLDTQVLLFYDAVIFNFWLLRLLEKGKTGASCVGDFCKPGLEMVYILSTHILLARIQPHSGSKGLGDGLSHAAWQKKTMWITVRASRAFHTYATPLMPVFMEVSGGKPSPISCPALRTSSFSMTWVNTRNVSFYPFCVSLFQATVRESS